MNDDILGFRAMAGGIDGFSITSPTHTPTPVKLLALAAHAEESAGYAVAREFSLSADARTLLRLVTPETTDEATVREQLQALNQQLYGVPVGPEDEQVSALYDLWASMASISEPTTAWTVTLSAMFQSPDLMFY